MGNRRILYQKNIGEGKLRNAEELAKQFLMMKKEMVSHKGTYVKAKERNSQLRTEAEERKKKEMRFRN